MKDVTTGKTVKLSFDPKKPPALTDVQKARSAKLKAMKDEEIDYSDIPTTTGEGWTRAKPIMGVQNKQLISLRLDPEVLEFFKAQGARYQTRISAVLQEYVRAHR